MQMGLAGVAQGMASFSALAVQEDRRFRELAEEYPESKFFRVIVRVGINDSEEEAKAKALAALSGQFKVSIKSTFELLNKEGYEGSKRIYSEKVITNIVTTSDAVLEGVKYSFSRKKKYLIARIAYKDEFNRLIDLIKKRSPDVTDNYEQAVANLGKKSPRAITAITHLILAMEAAQDQETHIANIQLYERMRSSGLDEELKTKKADARRRSLARAEKKRNERVEERDQAQYPPGSDRNDVTLQEIISKLSTTLKNLSIKEQGNSASQQVLAGESLDLRVKVEYTDDNNERHPQEAWVRFQVSSGKVTLQESQVRSTRKGLAVAVVVVESLEEDIIIEGILDHKESFSMLGREDLITDALGSLEKLESKKQVRFTFRTATTQTIEIAINRLAKEFMLVASPEGSKQGGRKKEIYWIGDIKFDSPYLDETGEFSERIKGKLKAAISSLALQGHLERATVMKTARRDKALKIELVYRHQTKDTTQTLVLDMAVTRLPVSNILREKNVSVMYSDAVRNYDHRPSAKYSINPRIPDQKIQIGEQFKSIDLNSHIKGITSKRITGLKWTVTVGPNITARIENSTARLEINSGAWSGTEELVFSLGIGTMGRYPESQRVLFTVLEPLSPVMRELPEPPRSAWTRFTIDLDEYVTDEDTRDSEMKWTTSWGTYVEVTTSKRGIRWRAEIAPRSIDWYGTERITFTVTDPSGLSDSRAITVARVRKPDAPPVIQPFPPPPLSDWDRFEIILDDYVTDDDTRDGEMKWTASWGTYVDVTITMKGGKWRAELMPRSDDWYGNERITFTVADPSELSDSWGITVTRVRKPNAPPVIRPFHSSPHSDWDRFEIILDDYVTDKDTRDSEMTWMTSWGTNIDVTISMKGEKWRAEITPKRDDWYGTERIKFTVTDPTGLYDESYLTVSRDSDSPYPGTAKIARELKLDIKLPTTNEMKNRPKKERIALDALIQGRSPLDIEPYSRGALNSWESWYKFKDNFKESPAREFTTAVADRI